MKKYLIAALLLAASSATMAQNVALDLHIGGPGYYGTIELGNIGRPPVIYREPMIIERQVRYVGEPLYLRVPPGHAKKWSKHCHAYNACGRPVYFVQDSWYNNTYAPHYRQSHGGGHDYRDERRDDRRDYRDDRRDDRRDERRDERDDDHGHGNGHGNGHGKGHGHDKH
ncbi:MAG: hypothetical protein V4484_10375 [Pseudomonadota bacterium]